MDTELVEVKSGWPSSTIKMIAIITMLIDHFGATVIERIVSSNPNNFNLVGELQMTPIVAVYFVMRAIGRIAFPIFIFLMTEGFVYTRSKAKYVGRMAMFALISEIPFDLAFCYEEVDIQAGKLIEFGYQNVFFTLTIGLVTIWLVDILQQLKMEQILRWILQFGVIALGLALAYAMRTDYDVTGVLAIIVGYLFRNNNSMLRMFCIVVPLAVTNPMEAIAFIDVWFISKYNGERGWNMKWFFYIFYPLHILILAGVCILLKL